MTSTKRLALLLLCLLLVVPAPCDSATYYGRLCIPSVGIDVGLYQSSNRQGVVDAEDSACIFRMSYGRHTCLIADHNTQGFASMTDIVEGDTATIIKADGDPVSLVCVDVLDGHNTGHGITDAHGISVVGQHDYLMYTCVGYWRDVRICQWDIEEKE